MRAIAIVVVLCIISCWTPVGADTTGRSTTLEKQYQAELERINSAISSLSDGKSRLLLDQGSGAEPPGFAMRIAGWGDMPFVTVYPVSTPVLTDLKGVGRCQVRLQVREGAGHRRHHEHVEGERHDRRDRERYITCKSKADLPGGRADHDV